jgi:hypothetical protein
MWGGYHIASQTWTKTTGGNVSDTLGNIVGSGDGAGIITITATVIAVNNGNTLRIEEGVTVKMPAGGEFQIRRNATGSGTLRIVGTQAEPVILTSDAGSPAPGDWDGILLDNTTAGSNPTLEADWMILEYAGNGIASATAAIGTLPTTATVRTSTFRRILNTHVLQTNRTTAGVGVFTIQECVFDRCPADNLIGSPVILNCAAATAGTVAVMIINHCSVLMNVNTVANAFVIASTTRGDLTVRNNIATGTNLHATGETRLANIAGTTVIAHDWNWHDVDAVGVWVDNTNDQAMDPNYFDEDCVGNNDLRPDFATGVMTADEFGARIGALDAYNIPEPPPAPEPESEACEDDYANFIDPSCIPVVCDYDFFTGEYPEDWRVELYDKKNTSSHQLVVCIVIPNKGIAPDFVFAPGVPIELIDITDETVTVNIGKWVQSMRPVKAERDVTFREYQGSDLDLVFMDWFGRLDPHIQGSLFHNLKWVGLRVDIGSWICGTEQVLKHGRFFLENITRRSESTVIRLKDWFLETLSQPLRANHSGYLTAKLKNPTGSIIPENFNIDESIAVIEKVKLVFVDLGREDSDVFEYIGSVTGFQGRGFSGSAFTTNDGGVTIPFTAWVPPILAGGPVFAPGDELGFTLSNIQSGTPVGVIYEYLTQNGDLVEGVDILQSEFFEAEPLLPTMAQIKLRHGSPVTLLEACRIAARHGFLTLSTNAEGRVVLGGFKPTLALDLSAIRDVCITSSNDLKELETANIEILNLIRTSYDPRESDEVTHSGLVGGSPNRWINYPTDDLGPDFNRSAIFYDEIFPFDLELPGFRAGQEGAVIAVLQNYWFFFEGTPTAREKFTVTTKLHNLNRDLEDLVYIESRRPERTVWGQIIGFAKAPLSQEVELTVVDVSDIVQPDFSCGYAFCDSQHYTDDCWVVW